MPVLTIDRVDVGPGSIEALVHVPAQAPLRTCAAPGLAERAVRILPGLRRHRCENGSAHGILGELADTETPHLLEHVAFELMALSGSPRCLRGETTWDFAEDGPGIFRVRLSYDDDFAALAALREAAAVVEWLMDESAEEPDVERIVGKLREVRARR